MNRIEKVLRNMGAREREVIMLLIMQIKTDHTLIPGVTKLKGKKSMFRVRVGQYRLLFKVDKSGAEIMRLTKRNEKTYKGL